MVDEMDLLSGLKSVEPVRPHAYEEARAVLRAAMAGDEEALGKTARPGRGTRWTTRRTVGFGAAALTAAAAVALVVTSLPAPGHHVAATGRAGAGAAGHAGATAPAAPSVNPILTQLAGDIKVQQVKLPGDATLEIRNHSALSHTPGDNGLDLYTDDGTYYYGPTEAGLRQAIAQHQDMAQGAFKRDMAAALYAVNGNITTARARMHVANLAPGVNPNPSQAEIDRQLRALDKLRHVKYTPPKPLTPAQKAQQTDSFIWMNSTDALTAEPENPQVRAGVLRIMATMPNVKVTHTTTAGQATLTLADSWPLLDPSGLVESLVINARTGFPVAMFNTQPGQPVNVIYYHASRVTVAGVAAGRL